MSEELCPLCGKEYWSTECPHDFQEMQEKIATLQRKLDIAVEALRAINLVRCEGKCGTWNIYAQRGLTEIEKVQTSKSLIDR